MSNAQTTLLTCIRDDLRYDVVIEGADLSERYRSDSTNKNPCTPRAVLRPRNTDDLATLLRRCHAARQPIVIQGGLTGLAGGATPRPGEIAVSLERMAGIEDIDASQGTMQVWAGTTLGVVQEEARRYNLEFAVDLGARGSCTVGGIIATNAGGNRVIRYGMTREQVIGMEVVLADGTIICSLNPMLKNNAGYDLKHLFIGTEGTLGVVTRAVLRLHPAPLERMTALVATPSFQALATLLRNARQKLGGKLGSFEMMASEYFEAALTHVKQGARPVGGGFPYYALLEIESSSPAVDAGQLEELLEKSLENGTIADGVVARSLDEGGRLWRIRDAIGGLLGQMGPVGIYDISLPIHKMHEYLDEIRVKLKPVLSEQPFLIFGHIGDGNLHIAAGVRTTEDVAFADDVVYSALRGFGSVSAEHGIGVLKRRWLPISRQVAEINLMQQLKRALDPHGILNPGRVI